MLWRFKNCWKYPKFKNMRFVFNFIYITRNFPEGRDGYYIFAVNNIPPNNDENVLWKLIAIHRNIFAFTEEKKTHLLVEDVMLGRLKVSQIYCSMYFNSIQIMLPFYELIFQTFENVLLDSKKKLLYYDRKWNVAMKYG